MYITPPAGTVLGGKVAGYRRQQQLEQDRGRGDGEHVEGELQDVKVRNQLRGEGSTYLYYQLD